MDSLHHELNDIIKEYQYLLLQHAYNLVRNNEDAQDIVQESLIRYIDYRRRTGKLIKNPKGWLSLVIRNMAMDLLRKKERRRKLVDESVNTPEVTNRFIGKGVKQPDQGYMKRETYEQIMTLLKQLNDREYEAITLQIFEHKSYKEIAEIMQLTTSHVGVIICKAMKKLQKKTSMLEASGKSLFKGGPLYV